MKIVWWRFLFCVASVSSFGCNTKRNPTQITKDLTKVDTVYSAPVIPSVEPSVVYDSSSFKQYNLQKLSRQFTILLKVTRFMTRADDVHDSCVVTAVMIDKLSKKVLDSVSISSVMLFSDFYTDSKHLVSYSTGANVFKMVDNYAGDLIIRDLNFDGKDDIVLVNDIGGNGGPFYSYFIQQKEKKFLTDKYLTDSVTFFPSILNSKRRTLTTYVHAGACCVGKDVYRLNPSDQSWRHVEHTLIRD